MLIALCVLAGLLIVFGFYLTVLEVVRFRGDRKPEPPLAPEEAARDRWTALVTDLIVGVLMVSALISLQANATFAGATDLAGQAQKATTRYQVANAEAQSLIEFGDRMTSLIQQHTLAAAQLNTQAGQARAAGETALATQLEGAARIESAEVRVITHGLLVYGPSETTSAGIFSFDRMAAQQLATELNPDLRTLGSMHAQLLETKAAASRDKAGKLLLAAVSLVAGVFFWTITRLGWKQRRLTTAVPALAAMAAGYVLLILATAS
jgi:hypothetical protein